jgi:hypothetical protein
LEALKRIFYSFCSNLQGTPSLKEGSPTRYASLKKVQCNVNSLKKSQKRLVPPSWGKLREIDRDGGVIAGIRP